MKMLVLVNQVLPPIIFLNSSKLTQPSPSTSTDLIILRQSLSEHFSPRLLRTECNSFAEIFPFLSLSYKSKASRSSLLLAVWFTPAKYTSNSFKSMKPSPSVSISSIIRLTSSGDVFEPSMFKMLPKSDDEILPSPLVSNLLNISLTSFTCSLPMLFSFSLVEPLNFSGSAINDFFSLK
ncbi:unnamed protein product [Coffea canephora]|uniref:Uncharacterized protein n=1 Tax=Coffea canephora TaxID=49390 RepID=A0A068U2F0_COFCA|nr:unnamed protein product [Coffea canephora]